ncbi:alpha/beta fold hydrolase [Pseudonocardia sp.]|uniref:alpha/beta fold hydrolase n=1 Tax=Pseudonocardia sp. TaxID=60912 RepID=UPI003D0A8227
MRALQPDGAGVVERDGHRLGFEVFGEKADGPTIFLTPTWALVDSRVWKAQVPFLARHHRVVTADPLGNGRSDRCTDPQRHGVDALVADLFAVLDAVEVEQAVLVGHCSGAWRCVIAAARRPERVAGVVALCPNPTVLAPALPARSVYDHTEPLDTDAGWAKDNWHYWRRDLRGFVEFFVDEMLVEPHSTKVWEDAVEWSLGTSAEVLIATDRAPGELDLAGTRALARSVECPVLVIVATEDRCVPPARGERLAELVDAEVLVLDGAGHLPMAREPVVVNTAIRDFAARFAPARPARRWVRPLDRPKRALVLCSPIGLGHVRRDLAIAAELRRARPGLRIDWLAQPPVAGVVAAAGERVHPASAWLAGESAHIESEAGEHDLRVFEAIRRMDEILVANFMVFADLVRDEPYDLWIADEGWEVDHFLHENPELKTAAYAWLTDFVGWLPMPAGGGREAALTADANAQMLDQVARTPRLRDRAVFIGDPDDVVPLDFGPDLPPIREWTARNFDFGGWVSGFEPVTDRDALRAELGWGDDERVCVVSVGGSGVGLHLLHRALAAHPAIARAIPGLRMVVVAGPRIDPAALTAPPGVEVLGYVPDLHRHLAACDVALVQGGLTTTMELTACGRPFVHVPVQNHFEQNIHVRHRLDRYGAGRCLDYADTGPEQLATALAAELARPVDPPAIPSDGARRVAQLLAELV